MRYNLDSEGMISEIGYMEHYEFEMEPDSPVNFQNYHSHKRVNNQWILITE